MSLRTALITVSTLCFASTAVAGVGEIINPKVGKDVFEAQYNATRVHDDGSSHNKQTHRAEFEYGFTESLAGEIGFKFTDTRSDDFDLDSVYVETKYQTTDQKDGWWLSSGILGEYVLDTQAGNDKLEAKILAQRDQEHFRHRGNLILERSIGAGRSHGIDLGSRWYSRWNAHTNFKPGFEWHADYGTLDHIKSFDNQEHYIGPALFGDLLHFEDGKVEYEVSQTFGITDASKDMVTRVKIEFKQKF